MVTGDWAELDMSGRDYGGVLVQYPDTEGTVKDYSKLVADAHSNGTLAVAACDLLSLCLIRPPGDLSRLQVRSWKAWKIRGRTYTAVPIAGTKNRMASYFLGIRECERFENFFPTTLKNVHNSLEYFPKNEFVF